MGTSAIGVAFSTPPPARHNLNFGNSIDSTLHFLQPQLWTLNILRLPSGSFPRRSAVCQLSPRTRTQSTDSVAGVLGATGSVGQRFILLLALHPHFELHAVGASERSAGKKYKDAVKWKQALPYSERIGELVVKKCTPEEFKDCDMVFSGLDSDVAGDVGRHSTEEVLHDN